MIEDYKRIDSTLNKLLTDFLLEIGTEKVVPHLTRHSDFEHDLGIDSLGRVEFLHRVEKSFGRKFPTTAYAELNNISQIHDYLLKLGNQDAIILDKIKKQPVFKSVKLNLPEPKTIIDRFYQINEQAPDALQINYIDDEDNQHLLSHQDLYLMASKVAAGLADIGIAQYESIAIMLPTGEDFFAAFLGTLMMGGIAVPIYPPFRPDRIEEYIQKEAKTLQNAQATILITFPQAKALSKLLKGFIPSLREVVTVGELMKSNSTHHPAITINARNPAFIQYTSGSTGDPKGVLLSHGNLLANIKSIGKALDVKPDDRVVSWLPLYHDMGLIGCFLGSLYFNLPLTIMSPLSFISRPSKWLWAIHTQQATISSAPNFAYEICASKIKDDEIEGLDLSSWRIAANGAEMVFADTLRKFSARFSRYGLNKSAMFPVYGLAENTVALSFPQLNLFEPRIDCILREPLENKGIAVKSTMHDTTTTEFVSCGRAIPDHEIKIVDHAGNTQPDRVVGQLWFKGPSAMQGYFNNPSQTNKILHGEWIDSGDLAYQAEGDIFITGRIKDLIIKAGRNIYPQDLEEITEKIEGVRKGCVAAFGIVDRTDQTEKIIIVAETSQTNELSIEKIRQEIIMAITSQLALPPDEVHIVSPRTVPKTSSGKLQRSACKNLYTSGQLTKTHLPIWAQISRLTVHSLITRFFIMLKKSVDFLYTSYFALISLLLILPTLLTIFLTPQHIAQKLAKFWVRTLLFLSFFPIKIHNQHILRSAKGIFIANHTSYIDTVILAALLPAGTAFVGKSQLANFKPLGWIIGKLGHLIVKREDIVQSLSDLEDMSKHLNKGKSLMIYPEGTFTHIPGLVGFKAGAFKLAVDNNQPIIPITLKGARKMLPDLTYLLHPTLIDIYVDLPIYPVGHEWAEVMRLKNLSRNLIAEKCGEPSFEEF